MKDSVTWRAAFFSAVALTAQVLFNVAFAAPISVTNVRGAPTFGGVAFDSATGEVYEMPGIGPGYDRPLGDNILTRYASAAAFEAGVSNGPVSSTADLWGTYRAAANGQIYARTSSESMYGWPSDARITQISASSGVAAPTIVVPGMGGLNSNDTFNWGGFSAVNVMNDGTHLYVVGHALNSNDWRIATYDYALNLLGSKTFGVVGNPGYGFAIGGELFFGDSYYSDHISRRVNATTGQVEAVEFTFVGLGSAIYLNDVSYDPFNDTLYLVDAGSLSSHRYYKVEDASLTLGVAALEVAQVPEPGTLMLLGAAVVGLSLSRRRRLH